MKRLLVCSLAFAFVSAPAIGQETQIGEWQTMHKSVTSRGLIESGFEIMQIDAGAGAISVVLKKDDDYVICQSALREALPLCYELVEVDWTAPAR